MRYSELGKRVVAVFLMFLSLSLSVWAQEASIPLPGDEDAVPMPGSEGTSQPYEALPGADALSAPDVSGYVENTFNYERSSGEKREFLLNCTRTRLNISGKPSANVDFGIGAVATLNSGALEFDMVRYMPDAVQKQIAPQTAPLFTQKMHNRIFLQEAFGTILTSHFRLRIGRHKFYTGTGYAYNPIDIFNHKNPLDPTYEIDGLDALLGMVELPHQTEVQGLMTFGDRLSDSTYMLRMKTYVIGWDMALQYSEATKTRTDWEALNEPQSMQALSEGAPFESFVRRYRWRLLAAEFVGELGGIGIHGEGGYAFIKAKGNTGTLAEAAENHGRFLIGADYTFGFQLYTIAEFLHIGQGRTQSSEITLNDRMAYVAGEILSTNRDTVFIGITYPLTDLADFSMSGIVACNDPSAIVSPQLKWSVCPGVNLVVTGYVPMGKEEGQNGNMGTGGFVRLKFSF